MRRSITPTDRAAVVDLAVEASLFERQDAGIVEQLVDDYFARTMHEGHRCLLEQEDGKVLAVAYWEPRRATDRGWELTMIAVGPSAQRGGRGSALLAAAEAELREAGQRMLLVETSGSPVFDAARRFYQRAGYDRVAEVTDYYEQGDSLVLFRKTLRI